MTFKEQIEADIAVFLNPDEFGESHKIDGKSIDCIVKTSRAQLPNGEESGIWLDTIVLHAATSALAALPQGLPKVDYTLKYDGRKYFVLSVDDQQEITRVEMFLSQG